MTGIHKSYADALCDDLLLFIIHTDKAFDRILCILSVIERLYLLSSGTLCLAVFPLCFKFLDMRGIKKHDTAQRGCSAGRP